MTKEEYKELELQGKRGLYVIGQGGVHELVLGDVTEKGYVNVGDKQWVPLHDVVLAELLPEVAVKKARKKKGVDEGSMTDKDFAIQRERMRVAIQNDKDGNPLPKK